jgi:hypothetical protein
MRMLAGHAIRVSGSFGRLRLGVSRLRGRRLTHTALPSPEALASLAREKSGL